MAAWPPDGAGGHINAWSHTVNSSTPSILYSTNMGAYTTLRSCKAARSTYPVIILYVYMTSARKGAIHTTPDSPTDALARGYCVTGAYKLYAP